MSLDSLDSLDLVRQHTNDKLYSHLSSQFLDRVNKNSLSMQRFYKEETPSVPQELHSEYIKYESLEELQNRDNKSNKLTETIEPMIIKSLEYLSNSSNEQLEVLGS